VYLHAGEAVDAIGHGSDPRPLVGGPASLRSRLADPATSAATIRLECRPCMKGGACADASTALAPDEEQLPSLRELLLDELRSDVAQLDVHNSRTGEGANRLQVQA
jgi:hypothetical protein